MAPREGLRDVVLKVGHLEAEGALSEGERQQGPAAKPQKEHNTNIGNPANVQNVDLGLSATGA